MHITGSPDAPPTKVGVDVVDVVTGLYALAGIVAALTARGRDPQGAGTHVEVSLFDAALASLANQASADVLAGADPTREGNRHPFVAPYEVVRSGDRPFVVAAANDRLFQRLCDTIGRHEVVLVVGTDPADAKRKAMAKAKWRGHGRPHFDALQRVDRVDGHEVSSRAAGTGDALVLDPSYEP